MAKIEHVLKDGRRVDEITGTVIRREEAHAVYAVAEKLNALEARERMRKNGNV